MAGADVLDLLTRLVDKSLVLAEEAPGGVARYRLLETLRQYAQHRLAAAGAAAPLRRRHAGCYLALAEALAPDLPRNEHSSAPASLDALDRLEAEHDNLRAALACFERDARSGGGDAPAGAGRLLRLAAALWRFWHVRGYETEGRRWLATALAAAPAVEAAPEAVGDPERRRLLAARAAALVGAGQPPHLREALAIRRVLGDAAGTAEALLGLARGDFERGPALLAESLALWRAAGDRPGEALALNRLGFCAAERGDLAEAQRLVTQALAIRRRLGDQLGTANSLSDLGHLARARGDPAAARAAYTEGLTIHRAFGPIVTANSLWWLAFTHLAEGDPAGARARLEEALALLRGSSPEDRWARMTAAWGTACLGAVLLAQGEVARAEALLAASLTPTDPGWRYQRVALALAALGGTAAARGAHERALRLGGAAAALRAAAGAWLERLFDFVPRATLDRWLDPARARLSPGRAAAAWAAGQAMTPEQAVAYALADAPPESATPDPGTGPPSDQRRLTDPGGAGAAATGPRAAGGHRRRPSGGLTRREVEVLRLVAAGKTNRQVAADLGLSPHTVARHLANVYAKRGLVSRTAAAAFALRTGLL